MLDATNSPRLLDPSRVGNSKILKSLGIKVVVSNPILGEHVQNHRRITVSFEAHDED